MNTICLSENTNNRLKDYLRDQGHHLIEIKRTEAVYDAISSHGDIYLCKLRDAVVIAMEQLPLIQRELLDCHAQFFVGSSKLGDQYPTNIKFNGVQLGNFFIHNTKHTDPCLLSKVKEWDLQILHVSQGYTKCNMVVVDENSAITSDVGIAGELVKHSIEVLLISQGHVKLTGFPYGFLGGASGRVDDEIIFNGNLSAHPDFKKIKAFIQQRGVKVKYFEEYPLEDIGSIIQLLSSH